MKNKYEREKAVGFFAKDPAGIRIKMFGFIKTITENDDGIWYGINTGETVHSVKETEIVSSFTQDRIRKSRAKIKLTTEDKSQVQVNGPRVEQ
jgi:hypothetical protein